MNNINNIIKHFVKVTGTHLSYPETVIYGSSPGKRITVSAGVHSREYVGIEAIRILADTITPADVAGELHLIHAFNYDGFIQRSSDVFPGDGKNLNREFPGDEGGSETRRFAFFLQESVIKKSDAIIDLHSGGGYEYLIPHVYFHGAAEADVCKQSRELAEYAQVPYMVKSRAENGFYSYAGVLGTPAIIIERGQCGIWSEKESMADADDVKNMLRMLGVLNDGLQPVRKSPALIENGFYENSPADGCWYPFRSAGDRIQSGEVLGEIRDIFGGTICSVVAKTSGVILYQTASLGIEKGSPMIAYGETI